MASSNKIAELPSLLTKARVSFNLSESSENTTLFFDCYFWADSQSLLAALKTLGIEAPPSSTSAVFDCQDSVCPRLLCQWHFVFDKTTFPIVMPVVSAQATLRYYQALEYKGRVYNPEFVSRFSETISSITTQLTLVANRL